MGAADTLTRPASTPAVRYAAPNVSGPTMRSTTSPTCTRPTSVTTREMKPLWTNKDVTTRHHSPLVVRGPTLAPQESRVSGSEMAPAPKIMSTKITTFTSAIAGVTSASRVRARSTSWKGPSAEYSRSAAFRARSANTSAASAMRARSCGVVTRYPKKPAIRRRTKRATVGSAQDVCHRARKFRAEFAYGEPCRAAPIAGTFRRRPEL